MCDTITIVTVSANIPGNGEVITSLQLPILHNKCPGFNPYLSNE